MTTGTGARAPSPRDSASPSPARKAATIVTLVAALPLLGYLAWRGHHRGEKTTRVVVTRDEGVLCLGAETGGDAGTAVVELRAEQPLAIGVRSSCLSTKCVTDRAAKCSVKREGSTIKVTSELSWTAPTDLGQRCPQECTFVEAACATDPLPPGSYTIELGSQKHALSLPATRAARCLEPAATFPTGPIATVDAAAPVALVSGAARSGAAKPVDSNAVPAAPGTGVAPTPPPKDIVCIGPASTKDKSRAIKVGQPLAITVIKKNPCVGASCAAAPPKCVVKRKGKRITLDAQFPGPTTKPRQPCTEDCNAMVATCRTDALPAGTYTIDLGTQQETVTVPSPTPPPCGQ